MFLVPDFKGHDFFPHGMRLPFMRFKLPCLIASVVFSVLSIVLISVNGFNYGVDFKGGSMIEVRAKTGSADVSDMRSTLSGLGLGDVQIQSLDTQGDVLIRVEQQPGEEEAQQAAAKKVLEALGPDFELRRIEVVGPAVSSELRTTGLIAVIASMVAIVLYVWFRFEWQFSVGVVVGLIHDVLITAGVFSLFWLQFDLSIVAALLTILGYSVNDSVVVADRIRENLRKYKKMPLNELLNVSINETLSRTILTGVTTLIVLFALFFLGGEVIRNFTFCMLFGVVLGTYSSVFISAPLIDYLGITRDWSGDAVKAPPSAGKQAATGS
ncbi:protein translocase subunit SecF [Hyphomicrobium sp. CS1GBMeth3]|uniref:protein translocase subunit SecF n=1 Tax=Hyphomicrobium sp. CS1GBMeth3 TaxID=1892845 RepID=UPI000930BE5D|nr:protein translocase subunit SecF [Hyphomicrobium sp. CS1GBMeth3]